MHVDQGEAMAGLGLLVCVADADRDVHMDEFRALQDALEDVSLPEGTTWHTVLTAKHDVDMLIARIKTRAGRETAYDACVAMAHSDGVYHEAEHAIVTKLQVAWNVARERRSALRRILQETRDPVSFHAVHPIADPDRRRKEVDEDVMKHSILAAALGLNPVPVAKVATELAVVGVQGKVAHDIGRYWGHATTASGAKQLVAGMGAGTAARVAVNSLVGFAPGMGSAVPAATNFSSTWAVGRVANQYFAGGCKLDPGTLRDSFKQHRTDGKTAYARNENIVLAHARTKEDRLERLGDDVRAGRITQGAYQEAVLGLT